MAYKKHGSYFSDYRDASGQRVRRAYPTKALAEAAEQQGKANAAMLRAAAALRKVPVATPADPHQRTRPTRTRSAR